MRAATSVQRVARTRAPLLRRRIRAYSAAMAAKKRAAPPSVVARKTKAPKRNSASSASTNGATPSGASPLRGLHFNELGGEKVIELTSLAKRLGGKQGDRSLASTWRRLGFDDTLLPEIDGVAEATFPTHHGRPRNKRMPGATSHGLQRYVRELDQSVLDEHAALLQLAAAELGGPPLKLDSRHKTLDLGAGAFVHAPTVSEQPRLVLTMLLEAFGIKKARDYVNNSVIPYLLRAGVRVQDCGEANLASGRDGLARVAPQPTPRNEHMSDAGRVSSLESSAGEPARERKQAREQSSE